MHFERSADNLSRYFAFEERLKESYQRDINNIEAKLERGCEWEELHDDGTEFREGELWPRKIDRLEKELTYLRGLVSGSIMSNRLDKYLAGLNSHHRGHSSSI